MTKPIIPVLGIPFYNRPDLLDRLICSIDYGVDRLVIVDNSPMGIGTSLSLTAHANIAEWVNHKTVIRHPNAGVAASWNEIIKLFPAPWWMLVNNDIQFCPVDLERMAEAANYPNSQEGSYFGNHGHSFFIITAYGVAMVGLFDENIYPAYLDDCDWMWRARQAAVSCSNVPGIAAIHGDDKASGSCTIMSDPEARKHNHRTHGNNFAYYRAKWGGINGEEKFKTPFNDPTWPVWAWRFDPDFRLKQQWL